MAAKKKASKKKVAKKKTSKSKAMVSMAEFEKQMEDKAADVSARISSGGGNFISIKGSEFSYQGADLGEELDVIVLDYVYENSYYDSGFDPDNPSTPACYSVSPTFIEAKADSSTMEPAENSPAVQSNMCEECDWNQWGSADTGRGKACKNSRVVAMISVADLDNPIEDIEIVLLRTPPKSISPFDKYVKGVSKLHHRLPYGVITKITFDGDEDYPKLNFAVISPGIDSAHIVKIMEKFEEAQSTLDYSYDPSGYSDGESKKKDRGKKKAKKKKSKFSR